MDRFPDENPQPVLRLGTTGALLSADTAAAPITAAWGIVVRAAGTDGAFELERRVIRSKLRPGGRAPHVRPSRPCGS
jgi:hypothetical protein